MESESYISGYQGIPTNKSSQYVVFESDKNQSSKSRRHLLIVSGSIGIFVVGLILYFIPGSQGLSADSRVVCIKDSVQEFLSVPLLGTTQQVSFCKTSCTNACATFPSVYGTLCCDWLIAYDGSKTCAQTISKEGVCLCEGSGGSSDHILPPAEPVSTPVERPVEVDVPKTHNKPKNDDGDNWGGDGWAPFGFEPMPGWKPFKPITVPDDAEECQKKCEHPCGWSQSNGHSMCCEKRAGKDCSITQMNGKCYCA